MIYTIEQWSLFVAFLFHINTNKCSLEIFAATTRNHLVVIDFRVNC